MGYVKDSCLETRYISTNDVGWGHEYRHRHVTSVLLVHRWQGRPLPIFIIDLPIYRLDDLLSLQPYSGTANFFTS